MRQLINIRNNERKEKSVSPCKLQLAILCHRSLSKSSENLKKTRYFLMFSGGIEVTSGRNVLKNSNAKYLFRLIIASITQLNKAHLINKVS